jgi:flagellar assembly protein FliH
MLSDHAESAMLRVHPQDVALLDGRLPTSVFAVGDAGVARGSFVLESSSTIVEDGPELWLEQLAHAIERVAMPEGQA